MADKGKGLANSQGDANGDPWQQLGDLSRPDLLFPLLTNKYVSYPMEVTDISSFTTPPGLDPSKGYVPSALADNDAHLSFVDQMIQQPPSRPFPSSTSGSNTMKAPMGINSSSIPFNPVRSANQGLGSTVSSPFNAFPNPITSGMSSLSLCSSSNSKNQFTFIPTPMLPSQQPPTNNNPNPLLVTEPTGTPPATFPATNTTVPNTMTYSNISIPSSSSIPFSNLPHLQSMMGPRHHFMPSSSVPSNSNRMHINPYGSGLPSHTRSPSTTLYRSNRPYYPYRSNYQYAYERCLDYIRFRPYPYLISDIAHRIREMDHRVYRCTTCFLEFPNAQAFGGHMSSHSKSRKARTLLAESMAAAGSSRMAYTRGRRYRYRPLTIREPPSPAAQTGIRREVEITESLAVMKKGNKIAGKNVARKNAGVDEMKGKELEKLKGKEVVVEDKGKSVASMDVAADEIMAEENGYTSDESVTSDFYLKVSLDGNKKAAA